MELARTLCELSREFNRQIGILVDRRGRIQDLIVGDARQITIAEMGRYRVGKSRFRGLRFVHTHLRGEPLSHDDLTDLALLRFDLMVAVEAESSGLPGRVHLAYLKPGAVDSEPWVVEPPVSIHQLDLDFSQFITDLEEEFADYAGTARTVARQSRRAILVGVTTGSLEALEENLVELRDLAESAGLTVVDVVAQRRPRLDPKFVVGSGKMKELYIHCMQKGAELMVFEGELSGSQVRAISEFGDLDVWDRTQLILEIFAHRAHSRGGKLQVELAMLKYSLPRLVLRDDFLSRLTGGIGARGPGETKIEELRRQVRDRIARLERELESLSRERALRRTQRRRAGLPVISIIGYTNAGKSTLLNTLTGSNVLAENRLFATLDPTSRRLWLPSGREGLLTDTVGFIRELPEELARAFRATLEELGEADLLLHLVDMANPAFPDQVMAVEQILADLALDNLPVLMCFNKVDLVPPEKREEILSTWTAPAVSARDPATLAPLLQALASALEPVPTGAAGPGKGAVG
ncbi:MAG: GTPase HflX [Candidatus Eremiobacterota bacterium]